MANYQLLKADIDEKVYQNGAQEITGANLNSVLNAMVTTLGAEYQFAGVATTATNPGTPDAKVFYIANGKGTYTNFGNLEVTEDEVVVLYWDTAWHKEATGIASNVKLTELESNASEQYYGKDVYKKKATLYGGAPFLISIQGVAGKTYYIKTNASTNVNVDCRKEQYGGLIELGKIEDSNSVFSFIAPQNFLYIGLFSETTITIDIEIFESSVALDHDSLVSKIKELTNSSLGVASIYIKEETKIYKGTTATIFNNLYLKKGQIITIETSYWQSNSNSELGRFMFTFKKNSAVVDADFKVIESTDKSGHFHFSYIVQKDADELTLFTTFDSYTALTLAVLDIDVQAQNEERFVGIENELLTFVKKEEGKGLSTNDFTDEYREKLNTLDNEIPSYVREAKQAVSDAQRIQNEITTSINNLANDGGDVTIAAIGANTIVIAEVLNDKIQVTRESGNFNSQTKSVILEGGKEYKITIKSNIAIGQVSGSFTIGDAVFEIQNDDLSQGVEYIYNPTSTDARKLYVWLYRTTESILDVNISCVESVKDLSLQNSEIVGDRYFVNPLWKSQSADPTIFYGEDGYYYMYHTGEYANVTMLRSANLVDWEDTKEVPFGENTLTQLNTLADKYGSEKQFYAPTIVRNGEYFLMYASITWYAMVVLRSRHPYGHYEFVGEPKALIDNTITGLSITNEDSCVARDLNGQLYLMWGSHGDMRRTKLKDDGLSLVDNATFEHIAGDPSSEEASRKVYEGLYAYRRNGYWYLFAAKGDYTSATDPYEIVVGRSKTLDGDFVDKLGRKMSEGYAELILEPNSVSEYLGGGHSGEIFVDKNNNTYIFYQRQKAGELHMRHLFLQQIFWDADGWPYFKDGVTQMFDIIPKM